MKKNTLFTMLLHEKGVSFCRLLQLFLYLDFLLLNFFYRKKEISVFMVEHVSKPVDVVFRKFQIQFFMVLHFQENRSPSAT